MCAARNRQGPCLLTFADEGGVWRLVGFNGDAAMLRLRRADETDPRSVAPAAAALILATSAPAATLRIFSYDPADDETRHAAGAVTFEFNQHLVSTTVLKVLATDGQATADLKPAREEDLGRGGLSTVIGASAPEHDPMRFRPAMRDRR